MLVGTWGRQQLWWGLKAGRELLAHSRVTNSTYFAFETLIEIINMEEKYICNDIMHMGVRDFGPLSHHLNQV